MTTEAMEKAIESLAARLLAWKLDRAVALRHVDPNSTAWKTLPEAHAIFIEDVRALLRELGLVAVDPTLLRRARSARDRLLLASKMLDDFSAVENERVLLNLVRNGERWGALVDGIRAEIANMDAVIAALEAK